MHTIYTLLIWLHISAGSVALLAFWLPVIARKGGATHRKFGNIYVYGMYTVAATAMLACLTLLLAPLVAHPEIVRLNALDIDAAIQRQRQAGFFLGLLALLLTSNLRHGILVLKARTERITLRTPSHLAMLGALLLASLFAISYGIWQSSALFIVFGSIALINSLQSLHYVFKRVLTPKHWVLEHLNNLLGAGIASHTAVLVVGAGSVLAKYIPANYQLLPWIAPGVIGGIGIALARRYYQQKFGVSRASISAAY